MLLGLLVGRDVRVGEVVVDCGDSSGGWVERD